MRSYSVVTKAPHSTSQLSLVTSRLLQKKTKVWKLRRDGRIDAYQAPKTAKLDISIFLHCLNIKPGLNASSSFVCWGITNQVRIRGAIEAIDPLKPTKVTLFTTILYNSEIAFVIWDLFAIHCFVIAVLWSILHPLTVAKALPKLTTKYYWNRHH